MIIGPGKWTVTFRPSPGARLRLLCFHHAGGGAFRFRPWAERLSPGIELVAVQLPGRENRATEATVTSLTEILGPLEAVLQATLRAPFAIFGHSLGAVLAYQLAGRAWSSEAMPRPQHLFLSAARPPRHGAAARPSRELSDAELKAQLETWGGTPRAVLDNPSLLPAFLRPLRADLQLLRAARIESHERLPIPFTLFRGAGDTGVRPEHLGGWAELTSRGAQQHLLSGGHFYDAPGEQELLQIVESTLGMGCPTSDRSGR